MKKKNRDDDEKHLFANGDPLFRGAILADDLAAPLKFAMAPLRPFLTDHVVASTAAKGLTVVRVVGRLAAAPSRDARKVHVRPLFAKVGTPLVKEEIRRLAESPGKLSVHLVPGRHVAQLRLVHQDGLLEALLEDRADASKIRRRLPAGLHLAATAHSVALAAHLHVGPDHLCRRRRRNQHHIIIGLVGAHNTERPIQSREKTTPAVSSIANHKTTPILIHFTLNLPSGGAPAEGNDDNNQRTMMRRWMCL